MKAAFIKYKVIIFIFLLLGIFILFHCSVYFDNSFKLSENFIENNHIITKEIGEHVKNRVSFFSTLSTHGEAGEAHYEFFLNGEKNKGTVYVDLLEEDSIWKITKANLFCDKVIPLL